MKKRIISMILVVSIMITYMPIQVKAMNLKEEKIYYNLESKEENKKYKIGKYEVKNHTFKMDSDSVSAARKYVLEKSIINISEEKITVSIDFTDKNLMSNIKIKVDGTEVKYTENHMDAKILRATFDMPSLDDSIEVSSTINTGFFKMDVSFRVKLDISEIPTVDIENGDGTSKPEEVPSIPEETPNPEPVPDEKPENDKVDTPIVPPTDNVQVPSVSENKSYKIYKVKNEILTDSEIGYSAARSAVSSTSYLEDIEGTKYITLGLSQLDVMSNVKVSVNGSLVSYEVVRKNNSNNTMDIKFKVPAITANVKLSALINVTGMTISFGINFLEETMELISKSEASTPLAKPSTSTVLTNNNSSNTKEDESKLAVQEQIKAEKYFKRYTIENDILSDSAMGRTMTRKYVHKVSILEDIDGKLYLTIKFSGSKAMDNIKIKVNGKDVEYSIVANDETTEEMALRFCINSIEDDIRVYMLVKAINKNIDFGIDLLKDTMVLIEEGNVQENQTGVNNNDEVLKKLMSDKEVSQNTGKIVGITIILTSLVIVIVEGIILGILKRRRKKSIIDK